MVDGRGCVWRERERRVPCVMWVEALGDVFWVGVKRWMVGDMLALPRYLEEQARAGVREWGTLRGRDLGV